MAVWFGGLNPVWDEQIVTFVRLNWGSDGLRAIYLGLEAEQTKPLISRSSIVKMLEQAMPLFSSPLDVDKKPDGKKSKKIALCRIELEPLSTLVN